MTKSSDQTLMVTEAFLHFYLVAFHSTVDLQLHSVAELHNCNNNRGKERRRVSALFV